MLELSWGGKDEIVLSSGQKRAFLEDNDTVVLKGIAKESKFTVGFGSCSGKIIK
jgi:fumarylacetoacetase